MNDLAGGSVNGKERGNPRATPDTVPSIKGGRLRTCLSGFAHLPPSHYLHAFRTMALQIVSLSFLLKRSLLVTLNMHNESRAKVPIMVC
jgi:hypothetical protein